MYAEIHFKGGSVARFEVTELTSQVNPTEGYKLKWEQPDGAKNTVVGIDMDEIAAALLIDEPLYPLTTFADQLAGPSLTSQDGLENW